MHRIAIAAVIACVFSSPVAAKEGCGARDSLQRTSGIGIADVKESAVRIITLDDVAAMRGVGSLSISPDGHRFAIFVYHGDPAVHDYRAGWYVGKTSGSALTYVGDGGVVRPKLVPTGHSIGEIAGSESRWSADGEWIAYTLQANGETQLWRSRIDGCVQEQVTYNAADVREFSWSEDGRALYFTVGTPRVEQRLREQIEALQGYKYDEDLWTFTDAVAPQLVRALETDLSVWIAVPGDRHERPADESERAAFERSQARHVDAIQALNGFVHDEAAPPARTGGALAWLVRSKSKSEILKIVASGPVADPVVKTCAAEECSGVIKNVAWGEDGERVLFWRKEGINNTENGFYAWSPQDGSVSVIARMRDDDFRLCSRAAGDLLICVRETAAHPAHMVVIDLRSGRLRMIADVNPEFRKIRLGNVERFEWDTPKFHWNEPTGSLAGLYPKRAYGYIIYPPDFDATKKYPVFIDPYIASGFRPLGSEHALHVYAANGFVVLRTAFPLYIDRLARGDRGGMKQLYSAELDFPHLTMLMESTIRGLDVVAARGFIDENRVGIGGVSHGTFIPLYMMQKHDRIAAISISSPSWGPFQYYWNTGKALKVLAAHYKDAPHNDWTPRPEGKGREFLSKIDIADHVEEIESPVLMNLAAHETYPLLRLIRHLRDAGKPYDAYVFPNETHLKWQSAHLYHIMSRNLDWLHFWLQDIEDPDPTKAEQYERWRQLRKLQCRNPRSLRDYCNVESVQVPIAR